MKQLISFVFIGFFSIAVFADIPKDHRGTVNTVIKRYRQSALVQVDIEKKTFSKLLKRETKEDGRLFFAGGLIRFEMQKPEPGLVVFDGNFLWNVQEASADFGGDPIITKARIDKKNRQQLIVTELLSKESLFVHFILNQSGIDKDDLWVEASPKKSDWNLTKLKLHFAPKENVVTRLEYWDDLDNHTDLLLKNQEFSAKAKKSLFKYQPPKGIKVDEL